MMSIPVEVTSSTDPTSIDSPRHAMMYLGQFFKQLSEAIDANFAIWYLNPFRDNNSLPLFYIDEKVHSRLRIAFVENEI